MLSEKQVSGHTLQERVLYPYQVVASNRIANQRRLLLADQPGLGKTLEVLGGLETAGLFSTGSGSTILILTPLVNAQTAWIATLEKFIKPLYPDVRIVDAASGSAAKKQQRLEEALTDESVPVLVVVANHDSIAWSKKGARIPQLFEPDWNAVIVDESHMVLPIATPGKMTQFWRGLTKLQYVEDPIKVAVSGTPDRGKLEYRYGTWLFLDSRLVGKHWDWLEANFNVFEQKVSYSRTIRKVGSLRQNTAWVELDREMLLRRTKEEVLPDLPPKQYHIVPVTLSRTHWAEYLREEAQAKHDFHSGGKKSSLLVFSTIARQLATRHEGESAKLEWLVEWLTERGHFDSELGLDGKVVVSSQYVKTLNWLRDEITALGAEVLMLNGSMTTNQRTAAQVRFQDRNDPARIILLSGGMGVGIDLDVADDLIMMDLPYDPDKVEQIEDRVHRASNMHKVTIWHVLANHTIDMAIASVVATRRKTTRVLLDGVRGIDFSMKVVDHLLGEELEDSNGDN